nr:MAG TPA: hypothetical protein [Caudoviricetes sp.]
MLIDVHRMFAKIKRINALKCDVNKIYILVLDKISGILYYVVRKGKSVIGLLFLPYSYIIQDTIGGL